MTTPTRPADVVLVGGTVVDGTGEPRYRADIAISGPTITRVGDCADLVTDASTTRVIDAAGLIIAPGFIDMHAHSDLQILLNPGHVAKISQGVTTEVLGQDGLSYAPVDDAALAQVRRQIAGWNGNPVDFDFSWRTVAQFLDRLDQGIATNAAYLVPQGTLRLLVVGPDDRPATADEIARMQEILAESLRAGAVGLSSGLTYTPGMYADTGELAALCEVVAAHGGYYCPHTRSYGAGALAAYAEMLDLARSTGCPVHLTHATMNFAENAGRAGEFLALVDAALADGCDISLDTYPYLPGCTTLSALLPSWAAAGGPDALLARLENPPDRERIRVDVEESGSDGCHGVTVEWDTIQISGVGNANLAGVVGSTVAEIAAREGRSGTEVFFDLLRRDELATTILQHVGHEDNVRAIMQHRTHMGGSDGILVGDRPHPRAWGTFPRYLARYSRELGLLGLEECVAHLTGRAATRLRLADRGFVREGCAADLVLFDPDTVADTATFTDPRQSATGIPYVLVNGVLAIDRSRPTGHRAGHALRRGDDRAVR
jgi:N-acyl-D-amino-acid deacylase